MVNRSGHHVRGSLVSQRVEMYETSRQKAKVPSASPTRKKTQRKYPPVVVESREETPEVHSSSPEVDDLMRTVEAGVQSYKEGDYRAAFEAFDSVLKDDNLPDDNMTVATILGNIGTVYIRLGQLDEAERSLTISLEMKRRLGVSVSDTLSNLGTCASLKNENEKSLMYYRDALQDLRIHSGSRKCMANALFNLGRLLVLEKEWETALGILRESIRVQRGVYGQNHVYVAQTLELAGFVQLSTEMFDAALLSFTGALAVYRRTLGPVNKNVANILFNIGITREKKMELTDAWQAYSTCRDLYQRLKTPRDYPGYEAVRLNMGEVEQKIVQQQSRSKTRGSPQKQKRNQASGKNSIIV